MTTDAILEKASYLHDAYVFSIGLTIDREGNRLLSIYVHCHPDCGFADWNDRKLKVDFIEPLIIHGELLGHMANAEEVNMVQVAATERMSDSIEYLIDAGIAPPALALSVVFQSGSQLDIACQATRVSDWD